jgi:hypothetical protein
MWKLHHTWKYQPEKLNISQPVDLRNWLLVATSTGTMHKLDSLHK